MYSFHVKSNLFAQYGYYTFKYRNVKIYPLKYEFFET